MRQCVSFGALFRNVSCPCLWAAQHRVAASVQPACPGFFAGAEASFGSCVCCDLHGRLPAPLRRQADPAVILGYLCMHACSTDSQATGPLAHPCFRVDTVNTHE